MGKILDPRFGNDVIGDFKNFVNHPWHFIINKDRNKNRMNKSPTLSEQLLNECSLDFYDNDEAIKFIKGYFLLTRELILWNGVKRMENIFETLHYSFAMECP